MTGNIMYDSAEAATYKTGIEGWVSSRGHFYGSDEDLARYDGCTHRKCECGNVMGRDYTKCDSCIQKMNLKRFYEMRAVSTLEGSFPAYSEEYDEFFYSEDDMWSFIDEMELENSPKCEIGEIKGNEHVINSLRMVICDTNSLPEIDESDFGYDVWPENMSCDYELPQEVIDAIKNLNKVIRDHGTVSYSNSGTTRIELEPAKKREVE